VRWCFLVEFFDSSYLKGTCLMNRRIKPRSGQPTFVLQPLLAYRPLHTILPDVASLFSRAEGNVNAATVPPSGRRSIQMRPPWVSTSPLQMERPSPAPGGPADVSR
jgi:hypothetical protein